jgi:hypothetical protein
MFIELNCSHKYVFQISYFLVTCTFCLYFQMCSVEPLATKVFHSEILDYCIIAVLVLYSTANYCVL